MKKTILIIILIIIGAAAYIAYKKFKEETPDIVNSTPDLRTNVTQLVAAFDQDTASAGKKYLNKVIEVTGTVKSIDTSGAVILGDAGTESSVVCGLDRRHMKDYEHVQPGTVAVIQGVCAGYEKADGDDLLASLGTTVHLRSAGVKTKNKQ